MNERNAQGLTEQEFLSRYNPEKYEHPSVTVDTLIFTVDKSSEDYHLQILLTLREDHPFLHKWAIPGGFVGMKESVEQAAVRELEEETGLGDIYLEQLYTWGDVERDPRTRIISVSYIALIPREMLLCMTEEGKRSAAQTGEKGSSGAGRSAQELSPAGKREENAAWYSVSIQGGHLRLWNENGELAEADLAFDHAGMIRLALERMKNKVFYTDIAFKLLPEKFTLTELQRLYEAILEDKLHGPNFRRDMQKWVEQTDEKCKPQKAGKPAWYFRQKRVLTI